MSSHPIRSHVHTYVKDLAWCLSLTGQPVGNKVQLLKQLAYRKQPCAHYYEFYFIQPAQDAKVLNDPMNVYQMT